MAVAIVVTDTADGSGGQVTVSGVTGTAVTTVYYSAWTGVMQNYAWTSLGSRTGNGTIAISSPGTVALGYYVWFAISVDAGATTFSGMVYQNLTTPTTSVHEAILNAVVTRINAIGLSGLPSARVKLAWIPRAYEVVNSLPCLFVCPFGHETDDSETNNQDDIVYPVVVAMVDTGQGDPVANLSRDLLWREKVSKALRRQRLAGVVTQFDAAVDYEAVVDATAFSRQYILTTLVLNFWSRQARGLGA